MQRVTIPTDPIHVHVNLDILEMEHFAQVTQHFCDMLLHTVTFTLRKTC